MESESIEVVAELKEADFSLYETGCNDVSESYELVLGGGGIKGLGHIGLLKFLNEQNIQLGQLTGVSIGSVIATLYANGYTPDEIQEIIIRFFARIAGSNISSNDDSMLAVAQKLVTFSGKGFRNLVDIFSQVVDEYKLEPKENLRIIAFNALRARPVVFEGTDYNLASALAGSCAIPLVMNPVRHGPGNGTDCDTINIAGVLSASKFRTLLKNGVLVDGGIYHPNPAKYCNSRAIVAKLGFARKLPSSKVSAIDYFLHLLEVFSAALLDWYYRDPVGHIVVPVGMPDVAILNFDLPEDKCRAMVDYGYAMASVIVPPAIVARSK